jgi:putative membrane protein
MMGFGGYGPEFHGAWGIVGIVLMILFWAAVILVLIAGLRWLLGGQREYTDKRNGARSSKTPAAILDERFARGEIDAEEYQARKRLLEQHGSRPD